MSGLVGKIVKDTYHFTEHIGRGGMAEVYKVWDAQRVIHLAAKVLHKDMALDKVFLRRFKREADTLTQLQHPHIIRSYGLQQEGRLAFLLMDFVEGESLKELIFDADGPLPPEQIRNILRPVAGALHYAHSMGFVHCDIKPANIMLDKYGEVRLADFGIARVTDAATATMVGAGTPAYMAPEQIKGQDPTPQTDIYALGIVLFEMLTGGERPFTGEFAEISGSTSEKIRWEQMKGKPPSMKQWNPNILPSLETLVQKCLAKDPQDRYQNPLELLNAFERTATRQENDAEMSKTVQQTSPFVEKASASQHPVSKQPEIPKLLQSAPPQSPRVKKHQSEKRKKSFWGYAVGGVILLGAFLLGARANKEYVSSVSTSVLSQSTTNTPTLILPDTPTKTPSPEATPTLDFNKLYADELWVLAFGNENTITAINLIDRTSNVLLMEEKCDYKPIQFANGNKFIYCDSVYKFTNGTAEKIGDINNSIINSVLLHEDNLFYATYGGYWRGGAYAYTVDLENGIEASSRLARFSNKEISITRTSDSTQALIMQEYRNELVAVSSSMNVLAFYNHPMAMQYNHLVAKGKSTVQSYSVLNMMPSQFYVVPTNSDGSFSNLVELNCDQYYYWTRDEKIIVCENGAYDISTAQQVDIPYLMLRDYVIEKSKWSPGYQKLGFIADGDIYVYYLNTNEVARLTTNKTFSSFSWSSDGNMLVAANNNIVVLNTFTKAIEIVIETNQTEQIVEWLH